MVLASCPPGGRVLDPFMGSGTTAVACARHGRQFTGYEINSDYCAIAEQRVAGAKVVRLAPVAADKKSGKTEAEPAQSPATEAE
jgi:site-specific DNA-methyltransferase (adenine-specific)